MTFLATKPESADTTLYKSALLLVSRTDRYTPADLWIYRPMSVWPTDFQTYGPTYLWTSRLKVADSSLNTIPGTPEHKGPL